MNNNRFLTAGLILLLLLGLSSGLLFSDINLLQAREETAESDIAFVNVQEVFENHPDKAEAEEQINIEAQELQRELEEEVEELDEGEQRDLLQEYQERLSRREEELIGEVLKNIEEVITSLAEEKNLEVVLEGENVLYGGYDLTPEVLEEIEQ